MREKIYLYSGIQPGKKGAGNFVAFFINKLKSNKIDFELIYYGTPDGVLVKFAKKIGIIKLLKRVYYSIARNVSKVSIKGAKIFIFHPQSIGLNIVNELVKENQIYLYVLDNFLFCKRSYNFIQGNNACLECIDNKNAHIKNNCTFFPNDQKQEQYDSLLEVIEQNLHNIIFLTQNENQGKLLAKKFGSNANFRQVGMLIDLPDVVKELDKKLVCFDFLYHNTLTESKGLQYFLNLAKEMPEYSFAIPYSLQQVKNVVLDFTNLENLSFLSVTWDTGLLDVLQNSKVIINPSLWSAPVEGALLKSIKYNGCVAVVPVDYSFQKEIPTNVVISLEGSIQYAKEMLTETISSEKIREEYIKSSRTWLKNYQNVTTKRFNEFMQNEFVNK